MKVLAHYLLLQLEENTCILELQYNAILKIHSYILIGMNTFIKHHI